MQRKRLERQRPIHFVQAAEQGSHKLHPPDAAQKLGDALEAGCILAVKGNLVVRRLELHVLGRHEIIRVSKQPGSLGAERRIEFLDGLEEDQLLVAGEGLDIFRGGGKGLV